MDNKPSSATRTISPTELAWRNLHISRSKLKASSRISALLAGFAMVALIEMPVENQVNTSPSYVNPLITPFVAFACLLIVVHLTAVLISTCLLPHLEAHGYNQNSPALLSGLHIKLKALVDMAWILSTILGTVFFLLTLIMACLVRFPGDPIIVTLCILPTSILLLGILAIVIYRKIVTHKVDTVSTMLVTLDERLRQLESGDKAEDALLSLHVQPH